MLFCSAERDIIVIVDFNSIVVVEDNLKNRMFTQEFPNASKGMQMGRDHPLKQVVHQACRKNDYTFLFYTGCGCIIGLSCNNPLVGI